MPITKRKVLDQITLEPETGTVLWRETTIIEEDGVEISRQHHRGSVEVDVEDSPLIPAEVKPFRPLIDTPAARAKVVAQREERKPKVK